MITPEQKLELQKTLGINIAPLVLERLAARGITTRNGKPLAPTMVSMVMNGKRAHAQIEDILFDMHDEKMKDYADKVKRLGLNSEN